jgi:uncharacterized protein YukE
MATETNDAAAARAIDDWMLEIGKDATLPPWREFRTHLVAILTEQRTTDAATIARLERQVDAFKASALLGEDSAGVSPAHIERHVTSLRAEIDRLTRAVEEATSEVDRLRAMIPAGTAAAYEEEQAGISMLREQHAARGDRLVTLYEQHAAMWRERDAALEMVDAFKAAALLGEDSANVTPEHVERHITELRTELAEANTALGKMEWHENDANYAWMDAKKFHEDLIAMTAERDRYRTEAEGLRTELATVNAYRADPLRAVRNLLGDDESDDEAIMGAVVTTLAVHKTVVSNLRRVEAEALTLTADLGRMRAALARETREADCRAICTYCREHDPTTGAVRHPGVDPVPHFDQWRGWCHALRDGWSGGSPLCVAHEIRILPDALTPAPPPLADANT